MRKIYVTGLGVISGIGQGVKENLDSLKSGKHGMGKITLFPTVLDVPVSEVKQSNEELKQILFLPSGKTYSRTALLGLLAAQEAARDAELDFASPRIGLISSTSIGGMDASERFYASFREDNRKGRLRDIISHDCGASTEMIAAYLGVKGMVTTLSTACSSAANAIMLGARLIRHGYLDTVLVGGTDALCRFTLNGFNSLMILDKEHCRPFDRTRAGLNLGEGAGYRELRGHLPPPARARRVQERESRLRLCRHRKGDRHLSLYERDHRRGQDADPAPLRRRACHRPMRRAFDG